MKKLSGLFLISCLITSAFSQGWGGGNMKEMAEKMKVGHFYGKILDSTSGKPVEFASVQLLGNVYDTTTKSMKKNAVVAGQLTKENGDFSLEKINVMGKYTLKIVAMGFTTKEFPLSFNLDMQSLMKGGGGQDQGMGKMMSAMNAVDKDLGNIKLRSSSTQLKEVTIVGESPAMEIKLDKKVFNVEKEMTTAGGTAEDVLKKVPSVNVDMDGNVTMRNASPQIFVDGRPTTLTIDQIPADAIESIEVITNPSAKYDASGGGGGILNIVLKKNKKMGYNGNLRVGIDKRGKLNSGGDINSRQGKINVFASVFYNQRKSIVNGITDRRNLIGNPPDSIHQTDVNTMKGYFAMGRAGFDYFMDNRNTITLTGMYGTGVFSPTDVLDAKTDSLHPASPITSSSYNRQSNTGRTFGSMGSSLLFKHIFPKEGKELTADANFNQMHSTGTGDFTTQYYDQNYNGIGPQILQKQNSSAANQFLTLQSDFVNPITKKKKVEMGIRAALRNFSSQNNNYIHNDLTNTDNFLSAQSSNYKFSDQVYAAYATYSQELGRLTYQAGLRAESSFYTGELVDSAKTFSNQYPVSLFPSAFVTYHLDSTSDLQLSFSRKINRPGFNQIIPYTDYSDSLNLKRGNPGLKPEFTNSVELNYLLNLNRSDNILISAYFKNSTNLITSYQVNEFSPVLDHNAVINTYENANFSYAYGSELTVKKSIKSWWDVTGNVNVYHSFINSTNVQNDLTNQQTSWFGKLSTTFKIPKNFSLQLSGDYQSKTSLAMNSGGGGRWGMYGGGGGYGGMSTAQGYILPSYALDVAIRKDFLKNKAASLTLSFSDILATKVNATQSETSFFVQNTSRKRDSQFFRFSFNYRFGKFDVSLFKRKNTKVNTEGMDMGM